MDGRGLLARVDRATWLRTAGGVAAVAVPVVLYTRYSVDGGLSRDEAVYAYGGQQLVHGVPPYASIFDPKAPLATFLSGLGVALARLLGGYDLHGIRELFLLCAVLTVLAVYLLVERLTASVAGGMTAAVVFASYEGFARDAAAGPDAKTPGVLFLVLCLWLALRRNWFRAACAGSLAFLVWQPLAIFPVLAVGYAALVGGPDRRRAVGLAVLGAAVPIAVTFCYFAAAGALGDFVDAAFRFPLLGIHRAHGSFGDHLQRIAAVVRGYYNFSGVLFWIGAALLIALMVSTVLAAGREDGSARWRAICADPLIALVGVGWLFEVGYALIDFQSYPDVYPLLPFPAIGIGVTAVAGLRRCAKLPALQATLAGGLGLALTTLALVSAAWFSDADNTDLRDQLVLGRTLDQVIPPGETVYSLGTPAPLVLADRSNPDRFIYLDSGVDAWKVGRTPGGFDGWVRQIVASKPAVVVLSGWTQDYVTAMRRRLVSLNFHPMYFGEWRVFVRPAELDYAREHGVRFTMRPTELPARVSCTEVAPDTAAESAASDRDVCSA